MSHPKITIEMELPDFEKELEIKVTIKKDGEKYLVQPVISPVQVPNQIPNQIPNQPWTPNPTWSPTPTITCSSGNSSPVESPSVVESSPRKFGGSMMDL